MRSYPITDEAGQPLGYGCGPRPPAAGDIAAVREYAEQLRIRKTTCGVCGKPTDTPPECDQCAIAEDARAVRRADR